MPRRRRIVTAKRAFTAWALAVFAITTGTMPLKSGGRIEQAKAPAEYRRAVLFCVTAGAFGFVLDWIVSWMVVSRA